MKLSQTQLRDWLQLSLSENVGPATFRTLINRFGGAAQALEALPDLSSRGGMSRRLKVCSSEKADAILEHADKLGAYYIAFGEAEFPPLLRHIDTCPPLLCVRGDLAATHKPTIAIVGARAASAAGLKFARMIAADLAAAGITVVSGLARGVDTAAHQTSCASGTVAAIAGGIDNIYPPENDELYQRIVAEGGAIVTEMIPGTTPQAKHFPRRNRIISGMSYGVVVIEAALRSGSLITARLANEQNRTVFAVPGSPLDPRAGGTNKLIKDGAVLVTNIDDILEHLRPMLDLPPTNDDTLSEPSADDLISADDVPTDARAQIISLLGPAPVEVDDIIRESAQPTSVILTVMLELELAGKLQRHGGKRVSLL